MCIVCMRKKKMYGVGVCVYVCGRGPVKQCTPNIYQAIPDLVKTRHLIYEIDAHKASGGPNASAQTRTSTL